MREKNDFEKASKEKPIGVIREFLQFLLHNKKWWLLPLVAILIVCSLLAFVTASLSPFLYTLF